jgi:hypothetical protein
MLHLEATTRLRTHPPQHGVFNGHAIVHLVGHRPTFTAVIMRVDLYVPHSAQDFGYPIVNMMIPRAYLGK